VAGRPVDVHVLFVEHKTWEDMTRHLTNDFFKGRVQQSQQPVVSLPMMPDSAAKQHAACATGAFDERFREFGRNLVAAGAGNAVVRLGWEANIGSDSHPWGIDSTREVPAFKSCFARLVGALKSTASNIKIEWSNAKRYDSTLPALTTCPGNAYVDIWGLHYYDRPPITSQAAGTARSTGTRRGTPSESAPGWQRPAGTARGWRYRNGGCGSPTTVLHRVDV
jgi:beta-mannanase